MIRRLAALATLLAGLAAAPVARPAEATEPPPAATSAEAPARGAPLPPLRALPPPPAAASGASGAIDPVAATRAYLDELSPGAKARSDAYFEGGYWLLLWDFLVGAAFSLLLLGTGLSARMRDLAERRIRWRALQPAGYWAQFAVLGALATLPYTIYRDHLREHRYGLSNLTLGGFLGEQAKGLLVEVLLGGVAAVILYAVVRRVGRAWWAWGTAATIGIALVVELIAPVLIVPLFNAPRRLADARVTAPILSLARANGIAANEVWEIDASRQSTRVSANVSGLLGTERITLNDNLLRRCSLEEIEAVMGHELGHAVLQHVEVELLELGLVILLGFRLVAALFERLRARREATWGVRGIADPAGLPLVTLLFSAYMLLMTPVVNGISRVAEAQADVFGLNAARQPDGFARATLLLSEYRKLEPGPLEEAIFYDHPSGRTRILAAMRWKAEHPETWSRAAPPR